MSRTAGTPDKPRRYFLECGHELWMRASMLSQGEHVYCRKCVDYSVVGPAFVEGAKVYYPEYGWSCTKLGNTFHGMCEETSCLWTDSHKDFHRLEKRMHEHHIRAHSGSSLAAKFSRVPLPRTPRNSAPPF